MKRILAIIILIIACKGFDEEKAKEDILSLIDTQDKEWFEIYPEIEDSMVMDTIKDSTGVISRLWREIEKEVRGDTFTFTDDTAFVDIIDTLSGKLLFYKDTVRYEKALREIIKRSAIYIRKDDGWELIKLSPAEGVSDTIISPFANLLWVRIEKDTLMPRLTSLDSIHTFRKGEKIEILAKTTLDTTEVLVFLYTDKRERFIPKGKDKDLWRLEWEVSGSSGMHRMVIYTINRNTLFGNWPYDANFWVIHYRVE